MSNRAAWLLAQAIRCALTRNSGVDRVHKPPQPQTDVSSFSPSSSTSLSLIHVCVCVRVRVCVCVCVRVCVLCCYFCFVQLVAIGTSKHSVLLLSTTTFETLFEAKAPHRDEVVSVALSHRSHYMATGNWRGGW